MARFSVSMNTFPPSPLLSSSTARVFDHEKHSSHFRSLSKVGQLLFCYSLSCDLPTSRCQVMTQVPNAIRQEAVAAFREHQVEVSTVYNGFVSALNTALQEAHDKHITNSAAADPTSLRYHLNSILNVLDNSTRTISSNSVAPAHPSSTLCYVSFCHKIELSLQSYPHISQSIYPPLWRSTLSLKIASQPRRSRMTTAQLPTSITTQWASVSLFFETGSIGSRER
jgi:hypothetical protein